MSTDNEKKEREWFNDKIGDYYVVYHSDIRVVITETRMFIIEGWQPFGSLVAGKDKDGKIQYNQPIVKIGAPYDYDEQS